MKLLEKKIIAKKKTPEFILRPDGIIKITGRSMIENISQFSEEIEDWIDKYICDPADLTCVDIYLEYLNTNNLKFFTSLLMKIESVKLKNKKYMINWYYEDGDEDMIEKGDYISSVLDVPFNLIMISDQGDI